MAFLFSNCVSYIFPSGTKPFGGNNLHREDTVWVFQIGMELEFVMEEILGFQNLFNLAKGFLHFFKSTCDSLKLNYCLYYIIDF